MRRIGIGKNLCALFGLALLLAAFSSAASARPLETGVNGVFDSDRLAFQRVSQAGAQYVVVTAQWGVIAPARQPNQWAPGDPADPNYDWSSVDAKVIAAVELGLTPVMLIHGAPLWAQRCASESHVPSCDPDPATLGTFATAAARRFGGQFQDLPRVRYWQGLNEPNLSLFFNPQFKQGKPASPQLYRALINAFYFAVKSVDRSNLVLAAGLGPIAIPRYTVGPMRFARDLLCMTGRRNPRPQPGNCGGGVHFDIFDVHPYTTGGPTHQGKVDDVQMGDLTKLQDLLDAADRAGRIHGRFRHTPLWVTEFTWDTKPPDPGGLPMRIATRWVAHAMFQAWDAGIQKFFWYPLRDEPRGSHTFSQTIQGGLFLPGPTLAQDKPKKLLNAFRFPFVAFSRGEGLFYWGRTPTSLPGSVQIDVQSSGGWRREAIVPADVNGIFTGILETSFGRGRTGMVRATYGNEKAIPFSLRPVPDFHQPPFG